MLYPTACYYVIGQSNALFVHEDRYSVIIGQMYLSDLYKPCLIRQTAIHIAQYTLKTPGSDLTRKRVRGGQTHFGVRPTRNPGQTDPESESDWPGIRVRKTFWTQIPVTFTRLPDQSDLGMGLAPWDPFPGQIWPGSFLECRGNQWLAKFLPHNNKRNENDICSGLD